MDKNSSERKKEFTEFTPEENRTLRLRYSLVSSCKSYTNKDSLFLFTV